ncbi:DUF3500 domain-containing protein [Gimesia aquarii]|uniref:DUF3500 domain-containing protein n=1 Tax=Gimesia aquarii TaxID=2527964 RepID=A0A517X2K3_9PLAN|nr:DUF3500 domain-containing protein [Gimesia aquarii]QDU11727.1 hypothetical protein V202x_51510 [Gimesia aquarii]
MEFNSLSSLQAFSSDSQQISRRHFMRTMGAALAGTHFLGADRLLTAGQPEESSQPTPEPLVKKLYESMKPEQKTKVCFDWDHKDKHGLLRQHIQANWNITDPTVNSDFFTKDQQEMIEAIFFGHFDPSWHKKIRKQLQDDQGGYGEEQSIAIFGTPGTDRFQFVMTGRHTTVRCDGDSAEHLAFGGPIFYGHAASGFNETANHPGNVFWEQALKANHVYKILDGKQRKVALIPQAPRETKVHFKKSADKITGLKIADMTRDQKQEMQKVLSSLIEPFRTSDQSEVRKCIKKQGGLDQCRISFYQSGDIGNDQVWDNWRLEGPAFVWHYRGAPHVHVWVNVSDDPKTQIIAS